MNEVSVKKVSCSFMDEDGRWRRQKTEEGEEKEEGEEE